MSNYGTFVPSYYQPNLPDSDQLSDASVVWGMSLSLTLFAFLRCFEQTFTQWRRIRKVSLYMVLIWLELWSSTLIGVMFFAYMRGHVPPSFWFFGGTILLWAFQVQCLYQIILNRASLVADNTLLVRRIQWAIFGFILVINIIVACIWISAQLQISERYIRINEFWDRTEKVILATIDISLNLYFVYLVRSTLIARGLSRYVILYRVNILMICISMTMDVLIITMMSLNNIYFYIFFHPLAYLVKLHIELSMANLIAKLVKVGSITRRCNCQCHRDLINNQNAAPFAPTIGRLSTWTPIQQYRIHHRINRSCHEANTESEPARLAQEMVVVQETVRQTPGDTWATSMTEFSNSSLGRSKSAGLAEELQSVQPAVLAEEPLQINSSGFVPTPSAHRSNQESNQQSSG